MAGAQAAFTVKAARKSIALSGYTRSRTTQTLASEVTGKVLAVNYDVGQTIGTEPFLEIDPTFVDFQIEQTQLSLQKLKVANIRAESQKDYLQKEFKRIDRLRQGNVATLAKWESAAEELKQAELALKTTDVEMGALSVQLKELKERRKRHKLTAPKGWIVVDRKVESGEIITSGTPLGEVADFTQMVIPLFVSGPQLTAIRKLNQIPVTVENKPAKAKLNWANPEFDERSRKLAVELVLVDFDGETRGGLLTELSLNVPSEGLMVPKASVTNQYNNPYVVTKQTGKTIPITILDDNGDHVIIAANPALSVGMEISAH
jgi:multidrug efflux pump subunit AcrA (membrane-fusion protein)